jgi:hypothetical protein
MKTTFTSIVYIPEKFEYIEGIFISFDVRMINTKRVKRGFLVLDKRLVEKLFL